jgi:cytochrome P450
MPIAQARVRTDRAARYLSQLGAHLAKLPAHQAAEHASGEHRPHHDSAPPAVSWQGEAREALLIDFGWGRCTVRADDTELSLHAEAAQLDRLREIEERIGSRVRAIGRRDDLAITWTRPEPDPEPEPAAVGGGPLDLVQALLSAAGRADPYPLYAAARSLGPVLTVTDGLYLVSGYAAVNQVLRNPDAGFPEPSEHAWSGAGDALRSIGRSILRANPPAHGRMRSLIAQVFTPRRVAGLRPAIERAVDQLLDDLAGAGAHGPVDFMDAFAYQLPVTVIGALLGVPAGDTQRFRPLAADLTAALELEAVGDLPAAADAAARELAGYFSELIAQRRAQPRDDLIGALVAARDAGDGRLSDQELLGNVVTLLVAGFETTTDLLGNGVRILFQRPELAEALRAQRLPVAGFIEEVLRYESPVQLTTRVARAALTVSDVPVPQGSQLILLIGAANRDPARYPDPDSFDPARADIRPLSFGAGAHVCIGNGLARLEAEVAFPRLLARFPGLAAAPGREAVRRDRLVLRGFQSLPVVLGG